MALCPANTQDNENRSSMKDGLQLLPTHTAGITPFPRHAHTQPRITRTFYIHHSKKEPQKKNGLRNEIFYSYSFQSSSAFVIDPGISKSHPIHLCLLGRVY